MVLAYKLFFSFLQAFGILFDAGNGIVTQQLEAQTAPRYEGYRSEYVKEFVIYGCYSIIRRWLTAEDPESPEDITDIILELIERL